MKILLIVYDNGSHIPFFPQGIAYLTASLKRAGHEVDIFNQGVYHQSEDVLRFCLDSELYDVVGLGFVAGYYQFQKAKKISKAVNLSKNRDKFIYVLGGHGPAAAAEYFRKVMGADTVFVGESEIVLNDFLDIDTGKILRDWVCADTLCNPDKIPWPAYNDFPIHIYRLIRWPTSTDTDFCMPILSGRGCKWKCSFCYRMDPGFRPRDPKAVIEEMNALWRSYEINHFQFSDELFMSSEKRVTEFCEELLNNPQAKAIKNLKFDCNGRLNYAKPDILKLMRRAGCEYVNYGIESLDDEVLREMGKGLTVSRIEKGVKDTIKAGLSPGLNFMWGNIGDTPETLQAATQFIIEHNPGHELRTIRPVTPYPGSPLFDLAVKKGLLSGVEEFYELKHVNSDLLTVNFTNLSDRQFHFLLWQANAKIVEHHYRATGNKINIAAYDAYHGLNNGFRGFRVV